MYIARATWPSTNGKSYESIYLRESYRDGTHVRKRNIANLTHCDPKEIAAIELALGHKNDLTALVETLSLENLKEYARMRQDAGITDQAAPVAQEVLAEPVATETPIETCAREFHELPSSAWKKKWLNNQTSRPIADECVAEGRI